MKVFVTGASGFIGMAVVEELLAAGHQVTGLARSEEAALKIAALGAVPHRGDLNDVESLKSGAAAADGVIHLGFIHDFKNFAAMCAVDEKAIEAMGEVLAGTTRPFLIASGTAIIHKNGLVTEQDRITHENAPRTISEKTANRLAEKGVHTVIIRLSIVHGENDPGFITLLGGIAKDKGKSAMILEGTNVWPSVHKRDAANLIRLALEKEAAPGTYYHAVAEQGIPFKNIATVIGKKLDLPVVSLQPEEVADHFTWFSHFAQFNNLVSSEFTRQSLGWTPRHSTLLEDMEGEIYFPANK